MLLHLVDLCDYLSSFQYTYLKNGKRVPKEDVYKLEDYKTMTLKTIEKYHIGLCWDITNYAAYLLKKDDIKFETFLIIEDDSEHWCHTFLVIYYESVCILFEPVYTPIKGIHIYSCLKYAIEDMVHKSVYDDNVPYHIYKYDTDGLDKNKSYDEFIEEVKAQNIIIVKETCNKKT